jgi:membrane-associated phospholipid phosphatase
METKFAKAISFIFHPLLITTYSFIILFSLHTFFSLVIPPLAKLMILGIVFVVTFLFPALLILVLWKRGLISELNMNKREDRIIPFIMTAIFFSLAYYLLKQLHISPIYNYFIIGTTFIIIIALIINYFWKISIHMIAMGGMLGAFLALSFVLIINIPILIMLIIFISGLVGFARLKLNIHSPAQVYIGFLTGVTIMFLLFIFI